MYPLEAAVNVFSSVSACMSLLVQTHCTMLKSKWSDLSDTVLETKNVLMKMSPEV